MRHRIRAFIASVLVCGVGLAQPIERGSFRMVWKGPAECPTDLEVLARVEALLGTRVSELELVPLAARGRITLHSPGSYELALETFQGEQRFLRAMKGTSCAELTDAGALVLALALDPTLSERRATGATPAGSSRGAPTSSVEPTATATPRAARPAPSPVLDTVPRAASPDATRAPEHPVRFHLRARAVLDFGTVADVAVGPGIGVAVQWRTLEASLDGVWLPTRRTFAAPGKGGDISLAAASLRGCYHPLSGVVEALGCGSFELGSLDGDAVGTVVRTHRSGLWAAPGALLEGRLRLGSRFRLTLGAGAIVPLQPIDFTLDNVGLVRRVPPLVARGEAGLHGHFD